MPPPKNPQHYRFGSSTLTPLTAASPTRSSEVASVLSRPASVAGSDVARDTLPDLSLTCAGETPAESSDALGESATFDGSFTARDELHLAVGDGTAPLREAAAPDSVTRRLDEAHGVLGTSGSALVHTPSLVYSSHDLSNRSALAAAESSTLAPGPGRDSPGAGPTQATSNVMWTPTGTNGVAVPPHGYACRSQGDAVDGASGVVLGSAQRKRSDAPSHVLDVPVAVVDGTAPLADRGQTEDGMSAGAATQQQPSPHDQTEEHGAPLSVQDDGLTAAHNGGGHLADEQPLVGDTEAWSKTAGARC